MCISPSRLQIFNSLVTFIADLRLELLEVPCDQDLVSALYGLLMLLPQTDAFHTLRARLACIPSLHLECVSKKLVYATSKTRKISNLISILVTKQVG